MTSTGAAAAAGGGGILGEIEVETARQLAGFDLSLTGFGELELCEVEAEMTRQLAVAKGGAGAKAAAAGAGKAAMVGKGAGAAKAAGGTIWTGKGLSLGLGLGLGAWGPILLGAVAAVAVYGYVRSRRAEKALSDKAVSDEETELTEALAQG
jgi:hypothetical protein